MTLRALLTAYVLGGLTFLPLLAICFIAALWYGSPIKNEEDSTAKYEDATNSDAREHVRSLTEGAASATFAVLRKYDLQGATAAFKEASNAAAQVEANGEGKAGTESISVYQSMYRSVFDRNKNNVNPLQEGEQAQQDGNAKAKARGKVFYIVLRHGHLMLYDSPIQFEVRHVISLAHYKVSLQDDIEEAAGLLDAELFTKRTAIVLTANSVDANLSRKPFYLFCDVNIEKEDFYHALLSCMADPPIPRAIDAELAIKLQSALHSNSLSLEDRALNALLGRIFLGTHNTPFLEAFVREKIEKKMARIPKPAFIASIACHSLSLGDAAPVISNLRLKEFNISGETVMSLDLKYTGGVKLTIAAVAKLDLGQRFKTRMVSLLLAVVLQRVQGKMLIKVKPPPSNRIWFCFETMPDMELKIEPVVSSRQITYSFVLRAIEARIREAFAEGLVQPNWDDVPFFATTGQLWRGGIWESEGLQQEKEELTGEVTAEEDLLSVRNGKSISTPTLVGTLDRESTSGAQSVDGLKQRSTASLASAQSAADKAWSTSSSPRPPKSVRSPSLASVKPLVAVDDFSADAVRSDDASAAPARRRWIGRGNQATPVKLDAAEVVRQVRDRDTLGRVQVEDSEETADAASDEPSALHEARRSSEPGADGPPPSMKKTMTGFGSAASTLPRLSGRREDNHTRNGSQDSSTPQRKTILATTAAATNAAKQWTWNAVANRANRQQLWNKQRQDSRASTESGESSREPSIMEPVGRGQPLPPPGVPLPGPQKNLWSAAAAGLGGMRRKPPPKLPARRPQTDVEASPQPSTAEDKSFGDATSRPSIDEYGPWMANDDDTLQSTETEDVAELETAQEPEAHSDNIADEGQPLKKVPPALPPRRKPLPEAAGISVDNSIEPLNSVVHDASASVADHESEEPSRVETQSREADNQVHAEAGLQNHTPPDLIDLDGDDDFETDQHDDHDLEDALTQDDLDALNDDIQAIPAPVDAEAEESGILELSEHSETLQQESYANKLDNDLQAERRSSAVKRESSEDAHDGLGA